MTLLAEILAYLDQRGISAALIGGIALAVHGIARATWDIDVLVVDGAVLQAEFWSDWQGRTPDVRRGDADDPLAGVIRFCGDAEPVDVIVGRALWQRDLLGRCGRVVVGGHSLPVVQPADLALLKLYAGGPQDLVDVELLVTANPTLLALIEKDLAALPETLRASWRTVRSRIEAGASAR